MKRAAAWIRGEHLAAWQWWCSSGEEVFPAAAVWGKQEDGQYGLAFKCPRCGETHLTTVSQTVARMERAWKGSVTNGAIAAG